MRNKHMLIGLVGIVVGVLLASVAVVLAGQIDSPEAPTHADAQMCTLEQIYDRLNDGTAATKMTTFTEPSSGPASTMHTLDEIYALVGERAQVPKTGQTTWYDTVDDGALEKGVSWPSPRFTDNSDGTVTDNLTGLIWLKNANCDGTKTWANALSDANALANGTCSLSDGSSAGDWRLPNVRELFSLIDSSQHNPALPSGHPFDSVQSGNYWSSTTCAGSTGFAWYVLLNDGDVPSYDKTTTAYVWPVRGGQ